MKAIITATLAFFLITVLLTADAGTNETKKSPANRIQPGDLTYLGAFRLPDGEPGSEVKTWAWGGFAMTYYPQGDPGGTNDGYPGSIFGCGHAWEYQVSEISIPVPVISATKNLSQLNTAATLQRFHDIMAVSSYEIPRVGMEYLPKQGSQTSAKLYFCTGQHFMDGDEMTHGWCELNLANPQIKRGWYLNTSHYEYNTNDYMFEIPSSWAALNTPGKILATGRFRDGGWSGQGPALYAIAPWNQGNPPPNGTSLHYVTLLKYTSTEDPESLEPSTNHTMDNYHHSDEWSGAVWLTSGNKSAVVFAGTKGTGDCWYGDSNGPCLECEGQRGWWSTGFEGQFIFYDPDDLARVAAGTMQPWEPQPYASLNIDQYLYHVESTQQWYHLGAACFDRARGYLYVFEPYVDDDKPIVHVWKVGAGSSGGNAEISLNRTRLNFGVIVNGTSPAAQPFAIDNSGIGTLNWTVSDNAGWLSCLPASGSGSATITAVVTPTGLMVGQYSATISVNSSNATNSPQTIAVILHVYSQGGTALPFGDFSTPTHNSTVMSSVPVTGWALDDVGVETVKIYRQSGTDRVYIGDAVFVEGARPDVEQAYPGYPLNYRAGWGYMMLTNFLPGGGNGTFTLYAVATDREGRQATLGSKTITCDNAHAEKPFGAIDTPSQGGTASGNNFVNWGWVLSPQPNSIPTNGTTIHVYVDGVNLGHPAYNIYRSDIAALFPGYVNSGGAAGYFYLDTTAYENGVHTIQWTAADNAGNSDGIGSRYFTIQNSSNSRSTAYEIEPTHRKPIPLELVNADIPRAADEPLLITRGYETRYTQIIYPDETGTIPIEIKEQERLEIHLRGNEMQPGARSSWSGRQVIGNRLTGMPIGSTLDRERGIFYWIPAHGFFGEIRLAFLLGDGKGPISQRRIKITILPKY